MSIAPTCPHERDAFARLPDRCKDDLRAWFTAIGMVAAARTRAEGFRAAAAEFAGVPGFSEDSIKRRWKRWRKAAGDGGARWRCLVNHNLCGGRCGECGQGETSLPELLLDHHAALSQGNDRRARSASWRRLILSLKSGAKIPGLAPGGRGEGDWRDLWRAIHPGEPLPRACPWSHSKPPRGWSLSNFLLQQRRRIAPAEDAAAKKGVAAARRALPSILRDTSKLLPLQAVVFDDARTDFLVRDPISGKIVELWGIFAMDVATRMILRYGLRLRRLREDGTRESITRRDMQHLIAGLIRCYGIPDDGLPTVYLVEKAAAAITDGLEASLLEMSGGMLTTERTNMITGRAIFADGFVDKAQGNPGAKGWIESFFNSMHTEAGWIAGQQSARYDLRAANLDTRIGYAENLLAAGEHLPPALRRELRIPFQDPDDAKHSLDDVLIMLNRREKHRIAGFGKVALWRWREGDDWKPLSDLAGLPPEAQEQVETIYRPQTPEERFRSLIGSRKFRAAAPGDLALLLCDLKTARYTGGGVLEFNHAGQRLRYYSRSASEQLRPGEEYLIRWDSADPETAYVSDGQGGFIGAFERWRGAAPFAATDAEIDHLQDRLADSRRELGRVARKVKRRAFDPNAVRQEIADTDRMVGHFTSLIEADGAIEADGNGGPDECAVATLVAAAARKTASQKGSRQSLNQRLAQKRGAQSNQNQDDNDDLDFNA